MRSADRKKTYLVALTVLLAALLHTRPSGVRAEEWIHLDPIEGEAVVDFDGLWRRNENSGSSRDLQFEESIRIRQSGYSLDPRIATFALEIEPLLSQGFFEAPDQNSRDDGLFLNYNGNISVLHGTTFPFNGNANFSKVTGTTDSTLGSRTDFDVQSEEVRVNWNNRAFPSSLTVSERTQDRTFRSGLSDTTSETENRLRSVIYRGRSSKTNLLLQRDWFTDLASLTDRDYTVDRARFDHVYRWGRGSRLDTLIDFYDRQGFNQNRRLTGDKTVHIQHSDDLYSDTSYVFQSNEQQGTKSTSHNGNFGLTHQLYNNLTTNFDLGARHQVSDVTVEDEYRSGLNFAYNKKIFWDGRFTAGVGGSYILTDRQSDGGFLSVVDESYGVPVSQAVLLNNRFIDTTSIIVTDIGGGTVYTLGADYTVAQVGNDLIELRIVSGGMINVGDTILVSYRFEAEPSLKFSTTTYQYNAGLDFDWISFFYRDFISNQAAIAGPGASSLTDRRRSAAGMELRWDGSDTQATFSAEKSFIMDGDFETDTFTFDQTLSHTLSPRLNLTWSTSEVFSASDDRDTDLYTTDLSLRWLPLRNLSIRPSIGAWLRNEEGESVTDGKRQEWYLTGGFDLRYALRDLEVRTRYNHNIRGGTIAGLDEDRVLLTVTRKF